MLERLRLRYDSRMRKLAIIGGGAAGLAAAIAAARALRERGEAAEVAVYEADERVGRSILATGNGRCNFSNAHLEVSKYRNAEFVDEALQALAGRFGCLGLPGRGGRQHSGGFGNLGNHADPVHAFFDGIGLLWREEAEGRLYPYANKATSVLDVLRAAAAEAGVQERCGCEVVRLVMPEAADARAAEGRGGQNPGRGGQGTGAETGRPADGAAPESGGHAAPAHASGAPSRFHLHMADGAVAHADAVVLACGGTRALGSLPDVLPQVPTRPVLGPLKADVSGLRALDNVRVRATAWLLGGAGASPNADPAASDARAAAEDARRAWADQLGIAPEAVPARIEDRPLKACEAGEVLFRSYGVSGIAVFNLSRFAEPGDLLLVDLLPQVRACDARAFLFSRRKQLAAGASQPPTGESFLRGMLLPQVARAVLAEAGLVAAAPLVKADVPALARALKGLPLAVQGVGDAKQCQVRRGGIDVAAVDPRTMAARGMPGLHLAGEALDVDAPCGGYNLHWAWVSGLLAGTAAATSPCP